MITGPLVDLGNLSQPITKLVEVISEGIGALYEPIGIIRRAKAEGQAAVIRAHAAGQVASIELRIAARLAHREATRQENIEKVAAIAANELPTAVSERRVDPDWTTQFINHAQDVSDQELQILWGRILAGEVTNPGTYSRRTLAFLQTLDKWEAEAFSAFCSCAIQDANGWHFVFQEGEYLQVLRSKFPNEDIETHFIDIGLLTTESRLPNPSSLNGMRVTYFGARYELLGPPKPKARGGLGALEISLSARYFSTTGQQLAAIAGATAIEGYIEKLSASLQKEFGVTFKPVAS